MSTAPELPDAGLIRQLSKFDHLNEVAKEQILEFSKGRKWMFCVGEDQKSYFMSYDGDATRYLILHSEGSWRVVLREGQDRSLSYIQNLALELADQQTVLEEVIDGNRDLFEHTKTIKRMLVHFNDEEQKSLYLYPNFTFDIATVPAYRAKSFLKKLRKKQRIVMGEIGKWLKNEGPKHAKQIEIVENKMREQVKKGYRDAARYSFMKLERELRVIKATYIRFHSKETILVTNKADSLFARVEAARESAIDNIETARRIVEMFGEGDWASKRNADWSREADQWACSITTEDFQAETPYCVVDGNNVAHSGVGESGDSQPFCPQTLLRSLYQLATRGWFPHAIIKHARREMYSNGLKNLIRTGLVTVTNRNDKDDDVHVVDYAINLKLCLISNDRFRDLVSSQRNRTAAENVQDYLDRHLYQFVWQGSYLHIHRKRAQVGY